MYETDEMNQHHIALIEKLGQNFDFHAMLELHDDAVLVTDTEGMILACNAKAVAQTGYTRDELIGMCAGGLFGPGERNQFLHQLTAVAHTDKLVTNVTLLPRSGGPVYIEISCKPMFAEEAYIGIFCMCKDIADRNEAEEELRATRQELADVLRKQLGLTCKFKKVDSHFVFTMADGELLYQLGLSPETVVGKALHEVVSLKSDVEYRQEYYERAWAGTPVLYESTMNGYTYLVSLQPMFREDQVVEVIVSAVDITTRKQAELELLATKNRLESYIEFNTDAIIIFDQQANATRINRTFEQMFGYTAAEVVGTNLLHSPLVPEELKEEVAAFYREALSTGIPLTGVDTVRMTKNGQRLNVLISTSPIRDADGQVAGWSAVLKDMTETKRAEELLLQSEKLSIAGQLAAGIAHEIRNPLTALKGFTQLMKNAKQEKNAEYLKIMESELDRIELILSELLVLGKPQAQKFDPADPAGIIQEVATLIESQANLHNIEIVTEIDADLPVIPCDRNQLKQVFINFLKNAIEAMPSGGVITVQVNRHGDSELLIRFIDQGCGIPEDRVNKIGEPFYTTKEQGTGLGLMVSKKIIEAHQGRLEVASQVGVGTTVAVYLQMSLT